MVFKAVIPAAGWGTRFLPATKALPKEMLPVVDRPAIHYVVQEAALAGAREVVMVTGRFKRAIEVYFDHAPELETLLRAQGKEKLLAAIQEPTRLAEIHYVRQREPKGLGDAVYTARSLVGNNPFCVLLPDEILPSGSIFLRRMAEIYRATGSAVIAVMPVGADAVDRYGIVRPAERYAGSGLFPVADLVEKPAAAEAPSNLAVIGRYVLPPEIFGILADLPPGRGGEIQLTDALRVLAGQGQVQALLYQGQRYDVGTKLGFLEANVAMALQRPDMAQPFSGFLRSELTRVTLGGKEQPVPVAGA